MSRHRAFAAVAAFVCAAAPLSAQGWSWGPMLGLSQTRLTNVVSADYRTGFTAGALISTEREDASSFWGSGLVLSSRGASVPNLGPDGKMVLTYVEVPLFNAWNIDIHNPWITPYVVIGAQLGFTLSCKVTGGTPTSTRKCDDPVFGTGKASTLDLHLGGGGGMTLTLNGRTFFVDGQYLMGNRAILANTRTKNRAFVLDLGYRMRVGKHDPQ
ncbi:MAG TPA: outer membrane beta-barrel protein [Gemmatimonadaceae bacterium]